MKRLAALAVLLVLSCEARDDAPEDGATPTPGTSPTPTPTATATPTPEATPTPDGTPPPLEAHLVGKLPHSGWSEGLDFHDGELWHAFPSSHRVYDVTTGKELRRYKPPTEYSESIAWIDGRLFNVSYSDSYLWVGTPNPDGSFTWEIRGTVPEVHAWGITWDGEHVVVTGNGSHFLYFLDPDDGSLVRTVETPIDDLEDIAWDRGAIWASSYSELRGRFFRLDPETGEVLDVFALPEEEAALCYDGIVDGLAVADGILYVTGKHCPHVWIYELR